MIDPERLNLQVDIDELIRVKTYLSEINRVDLSEIVWVKNGVKIDIKSEWIDEFQYTGLNNTDFISIYNDGVLRDN